MQVINKCSEPIEVTVVAAPFCFGGPTIANTVVLNIAPHSTQFAFPIFNTCCAPYTQARWSRAIGIQQASWLWEVHYSPVSFTTCGANALTGTSISGGGIFSTWFRLPWLPYDQLVYECP